MRNILKQFVDWATNFKSKTFLWARLKLTVFYTSGVFVILLIFSLAVFSLFVRGINSNLEYDGSEEENNINTELQIIDKAKDNLQTILITIDSFILFLIIIFSYYLSGKTLKPIETSYKRQKRFIADVAHELRTPLAVMRTGAEVNLIDGTDKERKRFIFDSIEEIDHLSVMVDNLLVLSKSDNFKKPVLEKVNLSKLSSKLTEHMRVHAKQKNVTLKTDIKNDCIINGNSAYLKRLLTNLIQNAIDYNRPNGEIKVLLKKHGKQIELKVVDTGIGISEKDLPNIFDRFYKVDEARVKSKGTGLGLSIVKEIVKMHKGEISIESELNKGTTVIMLLPV